MTDSTQTPDQAIKTLIAAKGAAFGKLLTKEQWAAVFVEVNGKVSLEDTRKAINVALRDALKAEGKLYLGGSKSKDVDWDNIERATYSAFLQVAKEEGGVIKAPLQSVVYGGLMALTKDPAEMDKVRKLVRDCMDREESMFQLTKTGKNWEGITVTLKDQSKAKSPEAFISWEQMNGKAPVDPPAQEAPKTGTSKPTKRGGR